MGLNPSSPTLKAYPTPGVGSRFDFFAKMKRKDELRDIRCNLFPLLRIFEHRGDNCLGGCCNPPPHLPRTRETSTHNNTKVKK